MKGYWHGNVIKILMAVGHLGRGPSWLVMVCPVCCQHKLSCRAQSGLLQLLPVARHQWSYISMDFTTGILPSRGNIVILSVVDHFSKIAPSQAHFSQWGCSAHLKFSQQSNVRLNVRNRRWKKNSQNFSFWSLQLQWVEDYAHNTLTSSVIGLYSLVW